MEQCVEYNYKYLNQFIKDNFINSKEIIMQDVHIADCGSVDVLIVEKDDTLLQLLKVILQAKKSQ